MINKNQLLTEAQDQVLFSLPAILAWEMANSVPGNTAEAAAEEVDAPVEPSAPAKRWYEIVREQDRERFDSPQSLE
jgi:hypothetical protein